MIDVIYAAVEPLIVKLDATNEPDNIGSEKITVNLISLIYVESIVPAF